MKVRSDALVAMLSFSLAPSPLFARPAMTSWNALRFSDNEDASRFAEMLVFDLMDQKIRMVTPGWERVLNDYKDKADIYYRMLQEMPEYVVRVPPRLWFPDEPQQPLLTNQSDDIITGGPLDAASIEWAKNFHT